MFRPHVDPLYYDTKANPRIFVPQVNPGEITETQQQIIESMPAEDRGEILPAEEYEKKGYTGGAGSAIVIETDQFEAAAKKHKLKE